MKCCSAQIASCWEDQAATLAKIRPYIRDAAGSGAAIIAFPEQVATGWDPRSHHAVEDCSGPIVSAFRAYAKEFSIAILGSFREEHAPLPFNTALAIRSDGAIAARYAKMHLFTHAGEDRHFSAGDGTAVFTLDGLLFGIAICYDLRFPELFRIYAEQGVHGVIIPAAWPAGRRSHWELFIRARAAENQMYVIGVNTTGSTPVDTYAGASMTAGPDGTIIARAGKGEALLLSDLDAGAVEEVRNRFPVHRDRRNDLYKRLQP